jgi:hypothetical protein
MVEYYFSDSSATFPLERVNKSLNDNVDENFKNGWDAEQKM